MMYSNGIFVEKWRVKVILVYFMGVNIVNRSEV